MRDRVVVSLRVSGDVIVSKPSARFKVCVCMFWFWFRSRLVVAMIVRKRPGLTISIFHQAGFIKKKNSRTNLAQLALGKIILRGLLFRWRKRNNPSSSNYTMYVNLENIPSQNLGLYLVWTIGWFRGKREVKHSSHSAVCLFFSGTSSKISLMSSLVLVIHNTAKWLKVARR